MNKNIIKTGDLLIGDEMNMEYRTRKKSYIEDSIPINQEIPNGWKEKSRSKNKIRIIRDKDIDELLEDKVWCLFYELTMQGMSASRRFRIAIKNRNGLEKTAPIDILAFDGHNVFVIECKSKNERGNRDLSKEIAEWAVDKDDIQNAIRALFEERDLRFIFILATENIIWNENDKKDAEDNKFIIIDEYDILALQELVKIAGEGARFQIYNRIFYGQKIKDFEITIPALKSKMGGQTYYAFVLPPAHLLKIAYVHHALPKSSFLDLSDSYQRMIKKSRINKIAEFIREGGYFPGNIILNFNRPFVKEEKLCKKKEFQEDNKSGRPVAITLPPYYGSAWVIDGQHRLYGYADLDNKETETVPVVAFMKLSAHLQAKIFVDINKNQKQIQPELLWDLYEDLYSESNDDREKELYLISKITKELNRDCNSPFYRSIAIPKDETSLSSANISMYAICEKIQDERLISKNEGILRVESDEKTIIFAKERIATFFSIFKKRFPKEWEMGENHYFKTNAAIAVFMGILRDLLNCNLERPKAIENLKRFEQETEKIMQPLLEYFKYDVDDKVISNYRGAGGAGQKSRQVRAEFIKIIRKKNQFVSPWYERYAKDLDNRIKEEKNKKGAKYYLDQEEGEKLEFKGTLSLNLNVWFRVTGKKMEDDKMINETLATIVAFLNTNGGEIIIGVLEKSRFDDVYEEKLSDCQVVNDKIIFGINNEYNKREWEGFHSRLLSLIEARIGGDVIDKGEVKINKLKYEDKDLCLIEVYPSDNNQHYLNNDKFFVRRGNMTQLLQGKDIYNYWCGRSK